MSTSRPIIRIDNGNVEGSPPPCATRLARAGRMAIIEDDYDHEFHYDGRPVLPLPARTMQVVVYIGTLSKVLAPASASVPCRTRRRCCGVPLRSVRARHPGDLATEAAVATLIEDWANCSGTSRASGALRQPPRDLANSLRGVWDGVEFTLAPGGMALWVRLRMTGRRRWSGRAPQRPARLSWYRPAYAFDGQPEAVCAIQLCLAERARAAGSCEAHGRGAPVAPIRIQRGNAPRRGAEAASGLKY